MSYILEALKKAQAERQLGELPTIHAPQLHGAAGGGAAGRKPLWLALGGVTLVVFVALLIWRQPWQGPLQETAESAAVPAPVVVASPVARPPAAPAIVAAAPAAVQKPVPPPAPVPVQAAAPAPVPAAPLSGPGPVPPPLQSPAPASAVAADETVPGLRDLPEPIQRQIPQVAIGGYIYSKNPADSLLLIDKILRHEGEELAPGLVLEKLLPKAAVFNFKGYRYRVPY